MMTATCKGVIAAVASAIALSSCADGGHGLGPTASGEGRACFRAADISSWTAADSSTVNLRVSVNDYYRLKLLGSCPDVDWTQRIGIEHRGSSWICGGLDATLIVPGQIGPRRCPVSSVHKLTPAEVAALPPKQKP